MCVCVCVCTFIFVFPGHSEPCPPTNVQASLACEQLTATVSWQQSDLAVGYVAYFDNQSGHSTSCIGADTDTSCVVSGLQCGTVYSVWVKALGQQYNSTHSSVVSLTAGNEIQLTTTNNNIYLFIYLICIIFIYQFNTFHLFVIRQWRQQLNVFMHELISLFLHDLGSVKLLWDDHYFGAYATLNLCVYEGNIYQRISAQTSTSSNNIISATICSQLCLVLHSYLPVNSLESHRTL